MTPLPPAPVPPSRASGAPVTPPAAAPGGYSVRLPWLARTGVPDPVERAALAASLGELLRRARAAAGLTQAALAALAGCHRRTVQRVESGHLRPTSALLEALAHALVTPPGHPVDSAAVGAVRAALVHAGGHSVVVSTPGGQRRRRRLLRRARKVVDQAAAQTAAGGRRRPPSHPLAELLAAAALIRTVDRLL